MQQPFAVAEALMKSLEQKPDLGVPHQISVWISTGKQAQIWEFHGIADHTLWTTACIDDMKPYMHVKQQCMAGQAACQHLPAMS
ncbi:MAG: hypothetical protein EOO38_21385 [Cytophagaceae bacterium]|nr:MAG: hypothetical protein EOO38_21385 [Cytophagaceae bacterium]